MRYRKITGWMEYSRSSTYIYIYIKEASSVAIVIIEEYFC